GVRAASLRKAGGVVRRDRGGYRIPESPFSDTYQIPSDPSRPIGLVSPIPDATHLTPSCPEHEPAERDDDPESRDGHGDRADTARREECPADETEQHDVPNFERPACHQADQDENWRVEYEPERGFTVEVRDDRWPRPGSRRPACRPWTFRGGRARAGRSSAWRARRAAGGAPRPAPGRWRRPPGGSAPRPAASPARGRA